MDVAIDCVNEQWNFISKDYSLSKNELLGAIRFVLDSTFFSFDNKIYQQSFGTPMDSPLSPIIADLVMRRLETVSLKSLNLDILFQVLQIYAPRCCRPKSTFYYNNSIRFILVSNSPQKWRRGDEMNFLDITISIHRNRFIFDWCRKPFQVDF